ncbi:hypothetical protein SO694_00085023 [Aureococcus anophagefferens]|uniref:Nucleotide-diphospho-sugar transferase domain-containing protein n=1 Tax=Aureococcus anophagefferens TaxID=44056 RepID=A0ABR1G416_AURAN
MILELVSQNSKTTPTLAMETRMSNRTAVRMSTTVKSTYNNLLYGVAVSGVRPRRRRRRSTASVLGAVEVLDVKAAGVARKCYQWGWAGSDVCFVQRDDDAKFTVADLEATLWASHAMVDTSPSVHDKWGDNHYAMDLPGTSGASIRTSASLAFVTTSDTRGLAPGLVALLRAKVFYEDARLFVAMDAKHRGSREVADAVGPYADVVEVLWVDVAASPLLRRAAVALQQQRPRPLYKTPWPVECYFQMVVPELLWALGIDHTVCIDYDVFTNDARLLEIPKVEAAGMIRLYPKERWREFTAFEIASEEKRKYGIGNVLEGYPAFHDAARRAAPSTRRAPRASFKDGTNYGVLVFNNRRMAAIGWTAWCARVAVASDGYMSGGQDLINLALAYPKTKNAWMEAPYCGYGQAVPLAASTGDLSVVTLAHFIWLPAGSRAIDDAILGVKGAIDEGHRTGHSFIAFATPWWSYPFGISKGTSILHDERGHKVAYPGT